MLNQSTSHKIGSREPLNLPLPQGVWKRIIRAVNTQEDVDLRIRFRKGKVVLARIEKELDIEE